MAELAAEPVPARVVEAYDQMMRQVIGPALRQLGFRGTVREFKYGDRSQSGTVRWQKDGRFARAQLMPFTANVDYWCGADRIGWLMPVPAYDTWWEVNGGQSYDAVADSVITARPLAVRIKAQADRSAPASMTMPVELDVGAGGALMVLETDPARCCHSPESTPSRLHQWDQVGPEVDLPGDPHSL
jgi:hypothetical protein